MPLWGTFAGAAEDGSSVTEARLIDGALTSREPAAGVVLGAGAAVRAVGRLGDITAGCSMLKGILATRGLVGIRFSVGPFGATGTLETGSATERWGVGLAAESAETGKSLVGRAAVPTGALAEFGTASFRADGLGRSAC